MATVPSTSNEQIIYRYLVDDLHLSQAGAAGVLGNFQVESGFSPTSYNAAEGAIGLANWELGRRTALQAYAAAHGGKETDLTMQLGYLAKELTGSFAGVLRYLRGATDAGAAAAYVDANYEKSAGTTRTDRINNAQSIYQQIQAGAVLTGGGTSTGGTIPSAGGAGFNVPILGDVGGTLSELLPWNWGDAISDEIKQVLTTIVAFLTKALFVTAGLGLVLLGVYTAARPERGGES
jgi:hypothetical protein